MTRVGIVVFPGSNCEHDVAEAVTRAGGEPVLLWHGSADLDGADAVVLPGGFAHGDYLRPGALARFSPVMEAVTRFAQQGRPVVGVCNGFQILTEAGLLPGVLCKNHGLKFLCRSVVLRVESTASVLTQSCEVGATVSIPINHFSGAYTCDRATLDQLETENRVVLRYAENPNGSVGDIAGICSPRGNVVGLMPHPERACDPFGSQDGLPMFTSLLTAAETLTAARSDG